MALLKFLYRYCTAHHGRKPSIDDIFDAITYRMIGDIAADLRVLDREQLTIGARLAIAERKCTVFNITVKGCKQLIICYPKLPLVNIVV
jgi:hypothetical protein